MIKPLNSMIVVILACISLVACGQSSKNADEKVDGTIADSLRVWLPQGEHKADLMDSLGYTARHGELLKRFMESAAEHQDWFIDATAKAAEGEFLQYHPKTGLSPDEWEELKTLKDSVISVARSSEMLTIRDSSGVYVFDGTGRLEFINIFSLDPKRMVVRMADVELPFGDTVVVADARNAFKSKWDGFSWRYEYPPDFKPEMLKDLANLTLIQYQFTVGRLQATGQRLISIKAKEIRDGARTLNLEIPILF